MDISGPGLYPGPGMKLIGIDKRTMIPSPHFITEPTKPLYQQKQSSAPNRSGSQQSKLRQQQQRHRIESRREQEQRTRHDQLMSRIELSSDAYQSLKLQADLSQANAMNGDSRTGRILASENGSMAALDRFDGSFAHDCHLPISRDDLEFIESHCRQDSKESQIHSDEEGYSSFLQKSSSYRNSARFSSSSPRISKNVLSESYEVSSKSNESISSPIASIDQSGASSLSPLASNESVHQADSPALSQDLSSIQSPVCTKSPAISSPRSSNLYPQDNQTTPMDNRRLAIDKQEPYSANTEYHIDPRECSLEEPIDPLGGMDVDEASISSRNAVTYVSQLFTLCPPETIALIEYDLPRTFPTLGFFHDGGPVHLALERILKCYAYYKPMIGYVQGMSYLASVLLLYVDEEEDAFICLANLINRPTTTDFYQLQRSSIDTHVQVFHYFLKHHQPLLYQHMMSEGLTADMYLMDWHLSLFAKCLPLEVVVRIWDIYFGYIYPDDGEIYLLRLGLGLLQMHSNKLLSLQLEAMMGFLVHFPENIDIEELLRIIQQIHISRVTYQYRLQKYHKFNLSKTLPTNQSNHHKNQNTSSSSQRHRSQSHDQSIPMKSDSKYHFSWQHRKLFSFASNENLQKVSQDSSNVITSSPIDPNPSDQPSKQGIDGLGSIHGRRMSLKQFQDQQTTISTPSTVQNSFSLSQRDANQGATHSVTPVSRSLPLSFAALSSTALATSLHIQEQTRQSMEWNDRNYPPEKPKKGVESKDMKRESVTMAQGTNKSIDSTNNSQCRVS